MSLWNLISYNSLVNNHTVLRTWENHQQSVNAEPSFTRALKQNSPDELLVPCKPVLSFRKACTSFQRKAMPKNVQTTAQLHSSHTASNVLLSPPSQASAIREPMNFLMFKLVLEKAEEPEIKLPTSTGSWKKEESSRKTSISALLTIPKPLTVCISINWGCLEPEEKREIFT